MMDEGYIKYQIDWAPGPAPTENLSALIAVRNELHRLGLIGVYVEENIGYGNVSQRGEEPGQLLVSGTQTGHIAELGPEHFATVTGWDLAENRLQCQGPLKASSESLTHAAIYDCDPQIEVVLHIHHRPTWDSLLFRYPTTGKEVAYGTPEMAGEVYRLYQEGPLAELKVFAMAGHDEGVFAFGATMEEARERLLSVVVQG